MLLKRRAGVLLHPSSLPGKSDQGDFGHEAFRFIEFLSACGFSVWQTLPLGPTHSDRSPYQSLSVHAGSLLLISLDWLVDHDWLPSSALDETDINAEYRQACLKKAYAGFCQHADEKMRQAYATFVEEKADWLHDYALFLALRNDAGGRPWMEWPAALRDREAKAMLDANRRFHEECEYVRFEQFVFNMQWNELRDYAHKNGVYLFGDMPIFVAHDSAEVWAHRENFLVDEHGNASVVAGVPPDYFSETGQRWGNPHYAWDHIRKDGFQWWIRRMQSQLKLFDLVRIDHFRGLEAYWEILAESETAQQGHWVKAPGDELLKALFEAFDDLPLVAEDLGTITKEVTDLLYKYKLPGMKILQFAFNGDPENPYLPQNFTENCVVYTGTHDNDTTLAWYETLPEADRKYLHEYLDGSDVPMPWLLNKCALSSVARLAMLPMQDILGLGSGHRMNIPGTTQGNWQWRFEWSQVSDGLAERLRALIQLYGRLN
ncbi:MAG: 4-alpha-glucanotransferase [Gammaproteobacteria bacterium]|nr:4-alpha-glucanotransferase [Gammaproteobacteria bacterium]